MGRSLFAKAATLFYGNFFAVFNAALKYFNRFSLPRRLVVTNADITIQGKDKLK